MVPVSVVLIRLIERFLSIMLIIYVVMLYVSPPDNKIRRMLAVVFEPVFDVFRRFLPPIKTIDFSPLVVLLLIQIIATVLVNIIL